MSTGVWSMMLKTPLGCAAAPRSVPRWAPPQSLIGRGEGDSFYRGDDLLQGGESVTTRQIVNVLGRWSTHEDWDTIGVAARFDDFSSGDFFEEDLPSFVTDVGSTNYWARRPARREFCQRHGLVQRWIHEENVQLLPFESEALAASVGATASELDAEPIDPLAAEIVFDALCGSRAGVVPTDLCDSRRASYVAELDGGFDAAAFASDLAAARRNMVLAYATYPGILVAIGLVLAIQVDAASMTADWTAASWRQILAAWGRDGPATLVLPAMLAAMLSRPGIYKPLEGSEREKAHVRKKDTLYLEKMRERRRGSVGDVAEERDARGGGSRFSTRR